ncbi:hypothetical protein O181_050708 [Austropuccinia psidii MF-1]|uniref:Glycosyltransferase family 31 protein n=1 Tax=Austropuccinia psidii MF-1 TaxID=1389203 RepID=A0A9Q3DZL6_9BASI|nr:hypothetical protein [Austropuccinia psidii MF-1]
MTTSKSSSSSSTTSSANSTNSSIHSNSLSNGNFDSNSIIQSNFNSNSTNLNLNHHSIAHHHQSNSNLHQSFNNQIQLDTEKDHQVHVHVQDHDEINSSRTSLNMEDFDERFSFNSSVESDDSNDTLEKNHNNHYQQQQQQPLQTNQIQQQQPSQQHHQIRNLKKRIKKPLNLIHQNQSTRSNSNHSNSIYQSIPSSPSNQIHIFNSNSLNPSCSNLSSISQSHSQNLPTNLLHHQCDLNHSDPNLNFNPTTSTSQPNQHLNHHIFSSNLQPDCFHSQNLLPTITTNPSNTSLYQLNSPYNYHPSTIDSSKSISQFLSSPRPSISSLDLQPKSPNHWFSFRRQKRKDSIHALSSTSISSTTSIHSNNLLLDSNSIKKPDHHSNFILPQKFSISSASSQSSSTLSTQSSNSMSSSSKKFFLSKIKSSFTSFISKFSSKSLSLRCFHKSINPRQPLGILLGLLLFISFVVSLTTFLVHFLDTDKEPLPWRTYCQEQREFPHDLADSLEPVNVFVGIFSIDSAYERRHLIRSTYARHSRPIDPITGQINHNVQLKFIIGRPRIQHVRRIALEMETFNDLVVLDIQENMNRGKTYAFMNWASQNATVPFYYHHLPHPKPKTGINGIGGVLAFDENQTIKVAVGFKKADFVVKADDDAFIVLSELERHLRVAPRNMTYWGYLIRNLFMGGECYALSADLVNYVATSEKVLDHLTGAEDKKVAKWMRIHPNASQINWVTERCWIYDHPKAGTTYAHGFLFPDQVERVRAEGRRGLTESEIAQRGLGRTQSYSTVSKWKERYIPPKSLMTMEEEVEALVEGGGRFKDTDWKRPIQDDLMVPIEKVLFDSNDQRLMKNSNFKISHPSVEDSTPIVKNHYQEPSLKFGRPPSELMAKMPPVDDLPESTLKNALKAGLQTQNSNQPYQSLSNPNANIQSSQSSIKNQKNPSVFIPSPTLRFDSDDLKIRHERFLNRPHGGTVVVHYLKRNEWFLETSLILLGRSKTWDDGLTPIAYDPNHQSIWSSLPLDLNGNSVVVTDNDNNRKNLNKQESFNHQHSKTKKIQVGRSLTDSSQTDQLEEIQISGLIGGARMYGSAIIQADGSIREGRRKNSKIGNDQLNHQTSPENSIAIDDQPKTQTENPQVDQIRKSQYGGAGWIRGKPRIRVADQEDGPDLSNHQVIQNEKSPNETFPNQTVHQSDTQNDQTIKSNSHPIDNDNLNDKNEINDHDEKGLFENTLMALNRNQQVLTSQNH